MPRRKCGLDSESVKHFFLFCPRHAPQSYVLLSPTANILGETWSSSSDAAKLFFKPCSACYLSPRCFFDFSFREAANTCREAATDNQLTLPSLPPKTHDPLNHADLLAILKKHTKNGNYKQQIIALVFPQIHSRGEAF